MEHIEAYMNIGAYRMYGVDMAIRVQEHAEICMVIVPYRTKGAYVA